MNIKCNQKHPEYCSNHIEYDDISKIVSILCDDESLKEISIRESHNQPLPSKKAIIESVDLLRSVLLPGYFGKDEYSTSGLKFNVGASLDKALQILQIQIMRSLCFSGKGFQKYTLCNNNSEDIVKKFLQTLPKIREYLAADIKSAYLNDPAATCVDETIFCYPGILALIYFRIAHEFYKLEVPLLPRIITEHAHSLTGIDIHPGATAGKGLFIDHGTGVVIGETAIIGESVSIYQGVTLGAKSFPVDSNGNPIKGIARHPLVEDDVIIYSGATILGRITIGKNSVIGGNVWLTKSIPPNSTILQQKNRNEKFENGGGI